jgi:glycosyl transferase family 87
VIGRWIVLFVINPEHVDFRVFYVAAEAGLRHGWASIYDIEMLRSLSTSFPPGEQYINSSATYVNAPILAWLIAPLTSLSLPAAYAVWTVVSVAVFVWAWHATAPGLGLAKFSLLLAGIAVWPVMDALYWGQPSLIVLALVAASWWLCARERPIAAGAVLAVATALKPQVVILVPIALLVSARYRPFIAWAATCAVIGIVSAIALGPNGLNSLVQTLRYVQSDAGHSFFTLARIFGHGALTYAIEGLLGLTALIVARRRRGELDIVFAAGIIGSLASGFHLHQPDYSSLVLAAWLVLRTAPPLWHRLWLLVGVATMQLITLGQPIPQLIWDAGWLLMLVFSSSGGSVESAPAIRSAGASAAREGT